MTLSRVTEPDDLGRIDHALDLAEQALAPYTAGEVEAWTKRGDDPLTAADLAVDEMLRNALPREDEGWLSEETADDARRLDCDRVWVVDPIDGTREFVEGIPEWCVSVGLVIGGRPAAGGLLAPATGQRIVGSVDEGARLNGEPVRCTETTDLRGALVLASRSEMSRGEWEPFLSMPLSVRNMGSVALKLGLVAAGYADATWTLVPKNEWDVAAGAALVEAAGGTVFGLDLQPVEFNRPVTLMAGFVAVAAGISDAAQDLLADFV